ncbi:unnamed protein product [Choristocarpus tenellus]
MTTMESPPPDLLNPLVAVRRSTADVLDQSRHVSINEAAVRDLAASWVEEGAPRALEEQIGWENCGWHYSEDIASGGKRTCQYIFVLDCMNFCFWPTLGLEYEHWACGLKSALEKDPCLLTAENLMSMDEKTLRGWFSGFDVPQASERVLKLRELGAVLAGHFDGEAIRMIERADGSASRLVRLVVSFLPGFRDETIYRGKQCFFYKRAQILAGDIWAAFGRQRASPGNPFGFDDVGDLTMFADYRIPQILSHLNVMEYSYTLRQRIGSLEEIMAGSEEEVEIRAGCVQAVELLRAECAIRGLNLKSVEIDWLLWHKGEDAKADICPHHRTLTIFY